ncbi:hypothetical protein F5879DRAFT_660711 [Lentinula edodes]|nr:hypothetical protein F5879DRAFT_660711 [Lentinula edodes]
MLQVIPVKCEYNGYFESHSDSQTPRTFAVVLFTMVQIWDVEKIGINSLSAFDSEKNSTNKIERYHLAQKMMMIDGYINIIFSSNGPNPLFFRIPEISCISIAISVLAVAGLILSASPLLWTIPVTFVATFSHHITMLRIARVEPHGSERLFSRLRVIWGFITAAAWTLCICVAVIATVLKAMDVFPKYQMHVGLWLMVTCAALALVESGLTWTIAIFNQKERKRITYAAKWRPLTMNHSWSINHR